MNELYIYIWIYIIILLWISYIVSKKENSEGFLIAERNRGSLVLALSKFAWAAWASFFVTYSAYAFEYGLWVYSIVLGVIIGYLIFAFWAAPKINKDSKEKKFYTQWDFVYDKTKSKFTKNLTNLLSIVIIFAWLMTTIIAWIKLVSYMGLMSYEMGIITISLVVMFYLLLAWFKAVLITDIIQSFIIIILISVLWLAVFSDVNLSSILLEESHVVDIGTLIGFFLFWILSVYGVSNWYQLCYAWKDQKTARNGIALSIIPIILMVSILLFFGMYIAIKNPWIDPSLVFLEIIQFHLPEYLIPLWVVLFFAAIMSSADTNMYAISSHYVLNKKSNNPVKEIRKVMVILTVFVMICAYFFRDIIDITVIAAGLSLTFSVPMIYLLLENKNPYRFSGSVFGGIIWMILGIIILGLKPVILITIILWGLLWLFYNKRI